jgi:hypothetical protein
MVRGWGRWYPVESVRIEGAAIALLQEQVFLLPPRGALAPLPRTDRTGAVQQEEEGAARGRSKARTTLVNSHRSRGFKRVGR